MNTNDIKSQKTSAIYEITFLDEHGIKRYYIGETGDIDNRIKSHKRRFHNKNTEQLVYRVSNKAKEAIGEAQFDKNLKFRIIESSIHTDDLYYRLFMERDYQLKIQKSIGNSFLLNTIATNEVIRETVSNRNEVTKFRVNKKKNKENIISCGGNVIFYIVKLELNNDIFYKVGLSSKKKPKDVFSNCVVVDVLYETELSRPDAVRCKNNIKKYINSGKTTKFNKQKVSGGTECFYAQPSDIDHIIHLSNKHNGRE